MFGAVEIYLKKVVKKVNNSEWYYFFNIMIKIVDK